MSNYDIFDKIYLVIEMKLDSALEDFINYCYFEKGLSDNTRSAYRNDLQIYIEFLLKKHIDNIKNVTIEDIESFLKERNKIGDSTTTIAHKLTSSIVIYLKRV